MTSLDFAASARRVADAARHAGHAAPGFRSPPRNPACRRSIRRRRNGDAVIAVQVKQRPALAVLADMVDGVIAANRLTGSDASDLRDRLWAALSDLALDLTAGEADRQGDVQGADATVWPIRAA